MSQEIDDINAYLDIHENFNEDIFKYIVEHFTTPDDLNRIKNKENENALTYALMRRNKPNVSDDEYFDDIKTLIHNGIDIDAVDSIGSTAMYTWLTETDIIIDDDLTHEVIIFLIENGANINHITPNNNETLLFVRVYNAKTTDDINLIEFLLNERAYLNIQNNDGQTPLMLAVQGVIEGKAVNDVVYKLIEDDIEADLDFKDNIGRTAYDILKAHDSEHILLPLIKPEGAALHERPEYNIEQYPRMRVNISKTVTFDDPIMLTSEEIDIGDYIAESMDNVVIVYNENKYFFTKRTTINNVRNLALVYPCGDAYTLNPNNVYSDIELYDMKKIGFISGYPCNIDAFYNNLDGQLFAIFNTDVSYSSFVSDQVLNQQSSWVSGLHCQEGQGSATSILLTAYPSITDNPEDIQEGGKHKHKQKKYTRKGNGKNRRHKKRKVNKNTKHNRGIKRKMTRKRTRKHKR